MHFLSSLLASKRTAVLSLDDARFLSGAEHLARRCADKGQYNGSLKEIETAPDSLFAAEKQELMLFLASRLRACGASLPDPTKFTHDEKATWISEDEAAMRAFELGS